MTQKNDENMLSRWSRRKHQTEAESNHEDLELALKQEGLLNQGVNLDRGIENELSVDAAAVDEEPIPALSDADMPPIESLHEGSDFSAFMSSGVSDELRNLALRKLFQAPVFNLRDGLDEYDEDYTYFEKLGDIVTCDMKHAIEMKEKKKAEAEAAAMNAEFDADETEDLPEVVAEAEDTEIEQEARPETSLDDEPDQVLEQSKDNNDQQSQLETAQIPPTMVKP
jgi:hypothetical protein